MSEVGEIPVKVSGQEPSPLRENKSPYQELVNRISNGGKFLKTLSDDFKRISEKTEHERIKRLSEEKNPLYRAVDIVSPVILSKQTLIMFGLWWGEALKESGTGDAYAGNLTGQELQPIPWIENIPGVEHMGNLAESYIAAYLTYYGLSLISAPLKEKISDKVKVAVSFLATSAFFTATELRYIQVGTPDIADIPAGILGPLIFSGVMLLNRRFIEDCGRAIKDLKKQIRQNKTAAKEAIVPETSEQPTVAP